MTKKNQNKNKTRNRILRIAIGAMLAIAIMQVSKKWEENQIRNRLETIVRVKNRECPLIIDTLLANTLDSSLAEYRRKITDSIVSKATDSIFSEPDSYNSEDWMIKNIDKTIDSLNTDFDNFIDRISYTLDSASIEFEKRLLDSLSINVLDSITTDSKRTYTEHYTIRSLTVKDLKDFHKEMKATYIEAIKNSDEMQILKDDNIIFGYTFKDEKGYKITSFKITPKEYR